MSNRAIIDEIVNGCAQELFALHDTKLEQVSVSLDPHDYVTVIGFYGTP